MDNTTFTFTDADVALFAQASWDNNPLHASAQYARTTPFGEQVVFGILGALKCLSSIEPPAGHYASKLSLEFRNPMLLETPYSVVRTSGTLKEAVAVMDGTRPLMKAMVHFSDGGAHLSEFPLKDFSLPATPVVLTAEDITLAPAVDLPYQPVAAAYEELLTRFGVSRDAWGDGLITFLLLSSYVVGMQIPGESAMFFSARVEMEAPRAFEGAFRFHLELREFDDRMNRAILSLQMSDDLGTVASAELQAFLRPSRTSQISAPTVDAEQSRQLAGKLAIVVGASRGLGANLALALAARGARVIGTYVSSDADTKAVEAAAAGLTGEVVFERANCGSAEQCQRITEKYLGSSDGLDILICCAAPSIAALRFEPKAADRILAYVQTGLDLVCQPMCAWLPALKARSGTLLYISSSAVEQPVVRWPHYVAMKSAGEGLVRTAVLQFPTISAVIARPGKIRTDLINTPMGNFNAEDPAAVADRLIASLSTPTEDRLRFVK